MNRTELSSRIAADTSQSKAECTSAATAVFSAIADALANGETVTIAGFGTLSTRNRAARHGRTLPPVKRSPSLRRAHQRSRPARRCGTPSTGSPCDGAIIDRPD